MTTRLESKTLTTDVLVIGGGLAGSMAGLRAREMGARVVLAEKADTRRSGCAATGIDHCWTYIPEVHGSQLTLEELVKDHTDYAGGFVDQEIATYIASHSFERLLDLERFGIAIRDGEGKFRLVKKIHRVPTFLQFAGRDVKPKLTRQLRRAGADIVNRVMVTDLLAEEGRVVGALGLGTRTGELVVFRARAVVLSTGNIYRLYMNRSGMPFNLSFPPHETGDGHAMALRAGAELLNMEFTTFQTGPRSFQRCGRGTFVPGRVVDAAGRPIGEGPAGGGGSLAMDRTVESRHAFERVLREGRGPIYIDCRDASDEEIAAIRWGLSNEGNTALLAYLDERGIDLRRDRIELEVYEPKGGSGKAGIAINARCETSLAGLYAAGDVIGGMTRSVSPGAFTLGWQAGESAARFAREDHPPAPEGAGGEAVEARRRLYEAILSRQGPRRARWQHAQAALQSIMDYYAGAYRSESMLEAGLARLARLREEVRAELGADNPHELYRAAEILSLIDCGEAIMRSARARRESRFGPEHHRADYPEPDEGWYCNTALRVEAGRFRIDKKPFHHIYR